MPILIGFYLLAVLGWFTVFHGQMSSLVLYIAFYSRRKTIGGGSSTLENHYYVAEYDPVVHIHFTARAEFGWQIKLY